MKLISQVEDVDAIQFPPFTGTRIMMMPFRMESPVRTLPHHLHAYARLVEQICDPADYRGVGYLTIDEAVVPKGEHHRRPGLHVDGYVADGGGSWGSGGGGWGASGMYVAASVLGSRAWVGEVEGTPDAEGGCEHLRAKLANLTTVPLLPGRVYWCSSHAIHESLPMERNARRQFMRISLPSSAAWYENYTPNPLGVLPTGPILPARPQMGYRTGPRKGDVIDTTIRLDAQTSAKVRLVCEAAPGQPPDGPLFNPMRTARERLDAGLAVGMSATEAANFALTGPQEAP